MCDKCETIEKTIDRYKWLKRQVPNHEINRAAETLISKVEAEKLSLYSRK